MLQFYKQFIEPLMMDIIIAIIFLLGGVVIGNFIKKLVQRVFSELEVNKFLKRVANIKMDFGRLIGNILAYLIYFFGLLMALNQLGITTYVLYMVGAAALIIIVVSFLLSIKDFIPNVISGFYLYRDNRFGVGDKIKVDNMEGVVSKINLVETVLTTKKKEMICIPNSTMLKSKIVIRKK